VACVGRRIIVFGPPKRGISLPPKGWFSFLSVIASALRFGFTRLFRNALHLARAG
jgi:hypothetical protein